VILKIMVKLQINIYILSCNRIEIFSVYLGTQGNS